MKGGEVFAQLPQKRRAFDNNLPIFNFGKLIPKLSQRLVYEVRMEKYADVFMNIGRAIDDLRKERKMTKTALADFSGLQECHIRRIILGKSNLTMLTFLKILSALDISLDDFFKRALKKD